MIPLDFREQAPNEMRVRASGFRDEFCRRRTVRDFSDRAVARTVIEECLLAASHAPSGANLQPWHFVVVSSPEMKRQIREAAEKEEYEFYSRRATESWLDDLAPLGTDWQKPFLETAPWLIAVFARRWGEGAGGERIKHYYVPESVGIATGLLIAALHNAGLATLTHTPSPMGFLNEACGRPASEKPYVLVVTGHAADGALVPDIARKPLAEVAHFVV
jgi:nitroreductase